MLPRFFIDQALHAGAEFALPSGPARHVQVLRLQPGAPIVLFDGRGGEWQATVAGMGRTSVDVTVGTAVDVDREPRVDVTIALGMPANDRMDAVVEKATELGVAAIQPLMCERSVLRLTGDRAVRKVAHWQGIAVAAAEQSGRTRVPPVAPVSTLTAWLGTLGADGGRRWVLSLRDAIPLAPGGTTSSVICLSGPEGGLSPTEEDAARALGFVPVSLGPRVLRADTAPVAVLACLNLKMR